MMGDTLYFTGQVNEGLIFNGDGSVSQILATGSVMVAGPKGEKGDKGDAGSTVSGVASVNSRTGIVTLDKLDVGLANVDNTSDVSKPVSTATQTALNAKVDTVSGKGLSTND
jgi:hypothetical protein